MKTNFTPEAAATLVIKVAKDALSAIAKEGITDPVFLANMADALAAEMGTTREGILLIWESYMLPGTPKTVKATISEAKSQTGKKALISATVLCDKMPTGYSPTFWVVETKTMGGARGAIRTVTVETPFGPSLKDAIAYYNAL